MRIHVSRHDRGRSSCAWGAVIALAASLLIAACGDHESARVPLPPPGGNGVLRLAVVGNQLREPGANQPVWLHGFNWGWWGTALEEDGVANVERGANVVRIPFRWYFTGAGADIRQTDAPGHLSPEGLAALDSTVRWATDAGLWVVLFAGSDLGAGSSERNFWTDAALRQEFFEAWAFLAQRYRNTPRIAAYELLSEPHPKKPTTSAELRYFYEDLIAVIRRHDKLTPLMIGPNDHYDIAQLRDVLTMVDDKLIYAANYYLPTEYCKPDQRGEYNPEPVRYPGPYIDRDGQPRRVDTIALAEALQPALDFRTRYDAPVFIDQVGCVGAAPGVLEFTRDALAQLRAHQVPWTFWTYRVNNAGADEHGLWYRPDKEWLLKSELDSVLREAMAR
ncbi:MAG TPA: cellulase family glycosylhydrolase [Ideonella sp.]|jgi:hypothetical protein|nr:cellulase family glycosylhydrolase [Ideonella sp.]